MFNEKIYDDMLERANKLWHRCGHYYDKEDILDFQIERCMCDCFPEYNGCRYCKGDNISIIIGSIDNKDVCCATVFFGNNIAFVDRIFFNGYRILLMAEIIKQMYKDNPYEENKIKEINLHDDSILDKDTDTDTDTDTDIDWTDTSWITKFKFVECKENKEFYKTIKINNKKKDNPNSKMNSKTKQEKKKEKKARRKERRKERRRKEKIKEIIK